MSPINLLIKNAAGQNIDINTDETWRKIVDSAIRSTHTGGLTLSKITLEIIISNPIKSSMSNYVWENDPNSMMNINLSKILQ